jgi:hypothetical protein
MNTNNPFNGLPGNDQDTLPDDDIRPEELRGSGLAATAELLIRARRAATVPVDFNARLQEKLQVKAAARQPALQFFKRPAGRLSLVAAGAVFLTVVLALVLPLLPHSEGKTLVSPSAPAIAGVQTSFPDPTAVNLPEPLTKPLLSFFGSNALAQSGLNGLFGQAQLILNTALPDGPKEAPVYEQHSDGAIDTAQAKALAAKLGIDGVVYTFPSEGGGMTYYVTDGKQEVWFMESGSHFTYLADFGSGPASSSKHQPLAVQVSAAETFLKQRGLLNFDYKLDEVLSQDNRVIFTRVLTGQQLLESDAYNPHIEVTLDGDGKVVSLFYNLNDLKPLGNYPLRSAQEAWGLVIGNPDDHRVQYSITSPEISVRHVQPAWVRTYLVGQRVDLYFYLDVFQPAEAGGQPWISMNGFTLQGDLSGLLAAHDHPQDLNAEQKARIASGEVSENQAIGWASFFHVWGQTSQNANGSRLLKVEGWEQSLMPDDFLMGVFKEVNGQEVFVGQAGQQWALNDIPADVPLDTPVSVRGVRVKDQPGAFNWSMIQVEPPETAVSSGGGGGGGGGGPLNFSPNPDATPAPSPTPLPMPYQVGQQVDGLVGTLSVSRLVETDGSKVTTAHFSAPLPDNPKDLRYYQLLGDSLQGLDSLNKLHARVWGTYMLADDGTPAILVQRYEKAYPDETIQAWLGHEQVVELDGRHVLQFTDVSGKRYIMARSLDIPEQFVEDPFNGAQIIIEGVVAQESYAGFPMITDFRGQMAVGASDLSGYTIIGGTVSEEVEQPSALSTDTVKNVTIDKAELVYFAYDFSHGGGIDLNSSPMRFVQPVWKFSGKLSDGRLVDVLVQAVTDPYLH